MHPTQPAETNEIPEKCLTVGFIADTLEVSSEWVIQVFGKEKGVVTLDHAKPGRRQKSARPYRSLRVPISVFRRVVERMRSQGGRA
jgi:hypothetical protein